MRKKDTPSKEELKNLMEKLGSMGKVAAELSKPYGTVRAWFNKYNLDRPKSCRHIFHELRKTPFSELQKSVVLGSILGDGGLQLPKHGKNAKLMIKHCTKQRNYLKWKKDLLNPFSRPLYKSSDPGEVVICGNKTFSTGSFVCYTICHPTLTEFFENYYISGKKRVGERVVDDLDLMSLAIWLADDGTFYCCGKGKEAVAGKICTNSFFYEEQKILAKALGRFFKGHVGIIRNSSDSDHLVLKLSGNKEVSELLKNIRSVLPRCIHYKLDPQRLYAKLPTG